MRHRQTKPILAAALFIFAAGWSAHRVIIAPSIVHAQQAPSPPPAPPAAQAPASPVIREESRVVRVDAIVTDKKGNYIHDLTAKDFHVFDNNQEQAVVNFSYGSAAGSSGALDRRYLVLFFDDSTMDLGDQARARDAAQKFIDANAGPDRVMAVVDFTGTLRVIQNFTADATRLKQAAASMKPSAISANAENSTFANTSGSGNFGGGPALANSESDFGVYTLLLGIRSLAKNLTNVPGRKIVVLFTGGFPLSPEAEAELTATISACNQANVAIYPLDVRGLIATAPGPGAQLRRDDGSAGRSRFASGNPAGNSATAHPRLVLASYASPVAAEPADPPQKGGGGGGGSSGGGGSAPGVGGTGMPGSTPYTQPGGIPAQAIMPTVPDTGSASQSVLYALAEGTGGFPMVNSNDLLGGLTKIAHEQDEYYFLGYTPTDAPEGSCHALRVKMERSGLQVRSRSGYCTAKSKDMLAGKAAGKDLESRAAAADKGTIGGTLQAPFFYTSPNEARVNVAMEYTASSVDFSKDKGKYHTDMKILGIAYRPDGTVAARFSDEVTLDLQKDEWKA